jgi:hypothetical protein
MHLFKVGRRPRGASYELTIYEANGRSRLLVGFMDRDEIDSWLRHHKLPDAHDAARTRMPHAVDWPE